MRKSMAVLLAVKAPYKGIWFYIAADDLTSKLTLMCLNASPVLTLPVG